MCAAFAEGSGSTVVGPVGEVGRVEVGVGDGVSENGEAGMNMPVGMEVGDVEGNALGLRRGVQEGLEIGLPAGAGGLLAAGLGVSVGMDDGTLEE